MVTTSVASQSLTSNDICSLARILEVSFQHQEKHNSLFKKEDYFKKLSTIVGLGFTTILVDGHRILTYQPHLASFVSSLERKSKGEDYFPELAHATANIVAGAALPRFDYQKYRYYPVFVESVKSALSHVSVSLAGKGEEAERLLQLLFKRW